LRKLEDETKCSIKFKEDHSSANRKDEEICFLLGKLEDVQASIVGVFNMVDDYHKLEKRIFIDYTIKMLIPGNYVTKLIGQSK